MDAIIAGYQAGNLTSGKVAKGISVFSNEVVDAVPTNIAAIGSRAGIGGVLLGSFSEIKGASVDLVEYLLRLFGIAGREQDVRALLCTVEHAVVSVEHVQNRAVVCGCGIAGNSLFELLVAQASFNRLTVLIFGKASGGKSLLPSIIRVVIGLDGFDLRINLGAFYRNALFIGGLFLQLDLNVVVDNLIAHGRGVERVLAHPVAPVVVARKLRAGAEILNVLGNSVFLDFYAVYGCRNATRVTVIGTATAGKCQTACSRKAHN